MEYLLNDNLMRVKPGGNYTAAADWTSSKKTTL